MAIENLPSATTSDESRLSGAYIRSLVKQLTTSKPLNTNENLINNDGLIVGEFNQASISTKKGDKLGVAKPNNHHHQQQQQGHKKQVRRRLHTSRPYQERLLNMAEARKEIVTALKFHRAAMKQANERKQPRHEQQFDGQHQLQLHQHQSIFGVQDYQTCSIFKNEPSSSLENFCYYPSHNNNNNNNISSSNPYPWGISSSQIIEPAPNMMYETLNNIPLPNQTLGLNLNLQAFTNLDTPFCHNINTTYNNPSSMSPSSSSSSTPRDHGTTATTAEGVGITRAGMDMHPALDDEEMAVIRSIGEQHQIEWDDTLNLVKSAWWLKYLKTVDFGKEIKGEKVGYDHNVPFGELMEFPPWLSTNNDESFLQQHLDDSCSEDTTLPWMDIGDIDGMDDVWLS